MSQNRSSGRVAPIRTGQSVNRATLSLGGTLTSLDTGPSPSRPPSVYSNPSVARSGNSLQSLETLTSTKTTRSHGDGTPVLWDLALQRLREREPDGDKETTILVIGDQGAGKTTIVNQYLERKETGPTRETVGIECNFGRRLQLGKPTRDVAQFWEIGGGLPSMPLIEVPLAAERLGRTVVVLVLDLSTPKRAWGVVAKYHAEIVKRIEALGVTGKTKAAMTERVRMLFQDATPNEESPEDRCPSGLPIIIVGNKYDEFQKFPIDEKKFFCGCLRLLSLYFGTALIFTDHKASNLISRLKSYISFLSFDHALPIGIELDTRKPLIIPWGKDTFESLSTPVPLKNWRYSSTKKRNMYDLWLRSYEDYYDVTVETTVGVADDADDPTALFPEQEIDAARRVKEYEFEKLRREKEKIWEAEKKQREKQEEQERQRRYMDSIQTDNVLGEEEERRPLAVKSNWAKETKGEPMETIVERSSLDSRTPIEDSGTAGRTEGAAETVKRSSAPANVSAFVTEKKKTNQAEMDRGGGKDHGIVKRKDERGKKK